MKEIKRFYIMGNKLPLDDGSPVSFKDHAAIVSAKDARISELELMLQKNAVKDGNEIAALQEQVRAVNALITEFWLTRHLVTDYVATPYMTDALNKIRAEGVCILTGKIQQLIDEGTFDAKEIGVAAGVVYEGAQIADKLRAGEQP